WSTQKLHRRRNIHFDGSERLTQVMRHRGHELPGECESRGALQLAARALQRELVRLLVARYGRYGIELHAERVCVIRAIASIGSRANRKGRAARQTYRSIDISRRRRGRRCAVVSRRSISILVFH